MTHPWNWADGPDCAYTHNGDDALLRSLGLNTGPWERWKWTVLGTATVPAFKDRDATIKVSVCTAPAQCFRFEITRPGDVTDRNEHFLMETGTGNFSEFWAVAAALAAHHFNLSRVDNFDAVE